MGSCHLFFYPCLGGHGRKVKWFIYLLQFYKQNAVGYDARLLGEHTS